MLILLKIDGTIEATKISFVDDSGVPSIFVENWNGGVHEYFMVAVDEVASIIGKDGRKSWDVL